MKWGGQALRSYCKDVQRAVQTATADIDLLEPAFTPILPETRGGFLYPLHKELDVENWLDRSVKRLRGGAVGGEGGDKKVCLLVRTAAMHGPAVSNASHTEAMDLQGLMKSLLRQSNPNWESFFFITDDQPFEQELQATIRDAADVRFKYLEVGKQFRPKYTTRDAGYTATDAALRLVQHLPQCDWLSITNADNIYGSEVINGVLAYGKEMETGTGARADVYIAPMDSRNHLEFAYKNLRKKKVQDRTLPKIERTKKDAFFARCGYLEDALSQVLLIIHYYLYTTIYILLFIYYYLYATIYMLLFICYYILVLVLILLLLLHTTIIH
ncbi:hypothetical protein B484DRAFT_146486 [Ochromonadaceae sp. CCMP2298]|nr:hypothetical protein B484DRAFT_146486 [Ochromonadaceae sp. CCMP2298]